MVVGTKGWLSHTGARTVSKIRQSGASDLETTERKAHWGKKRSQPVANHQKILRQDNDHSKMEWLGVTVRGRRETENPGPSTQGECLCMSVHDSEQPFLGFGGVRFLQHFPPKRRHEGGAPGDMRPPRAFNRSRGWVKSRSGLPAAHSSLQVRLSPTNACRCPGELCSWDSGGPRPAGRPHRKGWSSSPRCTWNRKGHTRSVLPWSSGWQPPKRYVRACSSCVRLCDPTDYSPPGSSVHRILQARILGQVAMPPSRGSSQPRDQTHVSCVPCIGREIPYHWTPWEDRSES